MNSHERLSINCSTLHVALPVLDKRKAVIIPCFRQRFSTLPDPQSVQKLEAVKMFSLTIAETTVGLSLSTYCWKALPEQNVNV